MQPINIIAKLFIGIFLFSSWAIFGQTGITGKLIYESREATPYEVVGLSILIAESFSNPAYWDSIQVTNNDGKYESKSFLGDDGNYYGNLFL